MLKNSVSKTKTWLAGRWRDQPVAIIVSGCILLAAAVSIADVAIFGVRVQPVSDVHELQAYYRASAYTRQGVMAGTQDVPRLYIARIPKRWADNQPPAVKKHVFYMTMLPIALRSNELILAQRQRLETLRAAARQNAIADKPARRWLAALARQYEIADAGKPEDWPDDTFRTLLQRVDMIPVSLALAQAAVESGYATSRFATTGNALYGQWRTGGGIRPSEQRRQHAAFGIASFASPLQSTMAYARNLNTFPAYRKFRALRASRRAAGMPPNGFVLAAELTAYSEGGAAYTRKIQRIIRNNRLDRFDKATLRPGRAVILRP